MMAPGTRRTVEFTAGRPARRWAALPSAQAVAPATARAMALAVGTLPTLLAALVLLATGAAESLRAQTVVGRVLDDAREGPVSGAAVRLLDKDGKKRAEALADATGGFVITPPKEGEYYLEATRIGYQRALSPLLRFSARADRVELDLMMTPAAIGLEGLAVVVDPVSKAAGDLREQGIEPANLGSSWITQADIDAIEIKRDVGSILEWSQINGLRVIRPENMTSGEGSSPKGSGQKQSDFGMCISLVRGRTWQGAGRCALIVVDGLPSNNERLLDLDPLTVAAMAVLQPLDARVLYGTRADAGAILVWTKR